MEFFINPKIVEKSREKARRNSRLLWIMAAAALALFVALCLMTRTGNARTMLIIAMVCMLFAGWGILAFRMFAVEPARAEARHLEGLVEEEPEMREGILQLDPEGFRIPKSVRVLKVHLDTGEETLSLNLNEKLRGKVPPDGSRVRVQTARKFIIGMETLETVEGGQSPRLLSTWGKIQRATGRFFPGAVIWTLLAIILTGFVFTRITDTDPAHKITIYADCGVRSAAELAETLERGMDGTVRMVKVHPFSFAMLDSEQIKTADLYIMPDSAKEEYAEWLGEEIEVVADPENGRAIAEKYFLYHTGEAEPVVYRLYLGASSVHREDGLARQAAELLVSLKTEKEEIQ